MTRTRLSKVVAGLAAFASGAVGCTQLNPAFDGRTAGSESEDELAGDGDPGESSAGESGGVEAGDGEAGDGDPSMCSDPEPDPCADGCTDVLVDNLHCGQCGNACADNEDCREGRCERARIIFVTQGVLKGNFGGIAGADELCGAIAAMHIDAERDFLAWNSDASGSPNSRFTTDGFFVRTGDGVEVAKDWEQLTSGQLMAPIDHDETGAAIQVVGGDCDPSSQVWTGTDPSGNPAGATCGNWLLEGLTGTYGNLQATGPAWTLMSPELCEPASCGIGRHLYCVEQ